MAAEEVKVFDWDDEVEFDGEGGGDFVTLEPGTYDFEVHKYERGTFTPKSENSKTPACNQIEITLKISTADGDAYVKDRFPLASTFEWKISSFFRSIGLKKHGERLRMQWDKAVGEKGRAKITKTKGNSDNIFFNNVDSYLDPVATAKGDVTW